MKQRIRINESQLNQIVAESVERVLYEANFTDRVKGGLQGFMDGSNAMNATNSTLHTTSSALSSACQYFGDIMKALSQGNIQQAQKICMNAYRECKGTLNSTYANGQNVTPQYGAQPQPNY